MNKCDLLHRKLNRGIMVKKYLPSYGDRDNDYNTVTHCTSSAYELSRPIESNFNTFRPPQKVQGLLDGKLACEAVLRSYDFCHREYSAYLARANCLIFDMSIGC